MNHKMLAAAAAAFLLSACGQTVTMPDLRSMLPSINTSNTNASAQTGLAASHWQDVDKIRNEAQKLSKQVAAGTLTKVQAAQYLNRYRLQLVGSNFVDDSVYDVYLKSVIESQKGEITSKQSKDYIENALRVWQQSWNSLSNRPSNPAFTNFLLGHFGMSQLK